MNNLPVLKYQENIQVVPDVSIPETLSSTKPVIFYMGRKITPSEALNMYSRLPRGENDALMSRWLDIIGSITRTHPHLLNIGNRSTEQAT